MRYVGAVESFVAHYYLPPTAPSVRTRGKKGINKTTLHIAVRAGEHELSAIILQNEEGSITIGKFEVYPYLKGVWFILRIPRSDFQRKSWSLGLSFALRGKTH